MGFCREMEPFRLGWSVGQSGGIGPVGPSQGTAMSLAWGILGLRPLSRALLHRAGIAQRGPDEQEVGRGQPQPSLPDMTRLSSRSGVLGSGMVAGTRSVLPGQSELRCWDQTVYELLDRLDDQKVHRQIPVCGSDAQRFMEFRR